MEERKFISFFRNLKFGWRYVLIITALALIACVGIIYYKQRFIPQEEKANVSPTEEDQKQQATSQEVLAVAEEYCSERSNNLEGINYAGKKYSLEKAFALNADEDKDKEIAGVCWIGGEYEKYGILFILDKQNSGHKAILEKEEAMQSQRYYNFQGLEVVDVDKNGIDEIAYGESGHTIDSSDTYLHLYSPKYQEWFDKDSWWKIEETTGARKEGTTFSSNLDVGKYKVFKDFLSQGQELTADNQCSVLSEDQDLGSKYYRYILKADHEVGAGADYDQKLIRRNKATGEETVVIASVKEALPEMKEQFNLILMDFAQPGDSQKIYFRSVYDATDNGSGNLYVYNVADCSLIKSEISGVLNNFTGNYAISPDQTKFYWVPYTDEKGKAQVMYLVNLADESYRTIINLSGNETFNGADSYMGGNFDISWAGDSKIKYAVFDQSKKEKYSDLFSEAAKKDLFVGYREYRLQN